MRYEQNYKCLTIEEIHNQELSMMLEVKDFFEKNNLKYSLCGGTLLGAIRHKGFIPWDDDVDMCMPRSDWDRFVLLSQKFKDQTKFNIVPFFGATLENTPFIKIINENIKIRSESELESSYLWIDIIPVDGVSDSNYEAKTTYIIAKIARKFIGIMYSNPESTKSAWKKGIKLALGPIFRKLKCNFIFYRILNKISRRKSYGETSRVGVITWGLYGMGEILDINKFECQTTVEFEGYKFSSMQCWREYLTGIYGDYMKIPAEKDRKTHKVKAWYV